ncbi:MAG: hypothetical protein KDE27_24150 [Planctomycetes bacterium]|nr:hypothetical protein [Planctomycetota bacterium]
MDPSPSDLAAPVDAVAATVPSRRVATSEQVEYEVRWCAGFDATIAALERELGGRTSLWVTTPTPHRLHAETFFGPATTRLAPRDVRVLECSERHKRLAEVERVCSWAQQAELGRDSVLVAIGGGVSSDIVTVAASLLRRGIAHIRVPTTLLGQVDAAVGAKGAVNFGERKNSLGCFHPAKAVLLEPRFLATLRPRELRSGLAEVFKAALAVDGELFATLERSGPEFVRDPATLTEPELRAIVWRAAVCMLDELEPNLYERRTFVRRMDFAHTFGPLLEVAAAYELTHGESVAIDAALCCVLASELGWLTDGDLERALSLMARLGLPRHHPLVDLGLCEAALEESIRHRGGQLLLFLPTGIGAVACLRDRSALSRDVLVRSLARWYEHCA